MSRLSRPRPRWLLAALASLLYVASLPGCAAEQERTETPFEYARNARRAYEAALEEFFDENWELARDMMDNVTRQYAYSRYGRLAELRIADIAFRQPDYAEAISKYRQFIHDYPNDAEVPYARYRVTVAQFRSSGASFFLPPLEERDLATVHDAYQSVLAYLRDYPESKYEPELRYQLEVVGGVLARHELYVARFYLGRDNFEAAASRAEYAVRQYQDSGLEPEALVLLGETYLKMKRSGKARRAFEEVLTRFPESPFTRPALNFLARLGPPLAKRRIP